jgi:hypothetical protein
MKKVNEWMNPLKLTLKFGCIIQNCYNFLFIVLTSVVDGGFAFIILQIIKTIVELE